MTPAHLFELLDDWTNRGWMRSLDRAFVRFLNREVPQNSGEVLLAAALVSHQLGRGHVCLDLKIALADPDATLSLPPEGETGEDLPDKPSKVLQGLSLKAWENFLTDSVLVTGDTTQQRPLVLNSHRLYLYRSWQHTCFVAETIKELMARRFPVPTDLSWRLGWAFSSLRSPREASGKEIHWQSLAAGVAARNAFTVISGGPGTGKTTTVVQILALLQSLALEGGSALKIRLAAPTGKAAARLTESMGSALDQLSDDIKVHMPREVTTIHRLLGSRPDSRHFVHHGRNRLHVDLLVVDEASMVDLEMMAAMLDALPAHARLILLGDKDQLASVEAGAVLGDLCRDADPPRYDKAFMDWAREYTGYSLKKFKGKPGPMQEHIVVLQKSHRFGEKSGIGALARAVNEGDAKKSMGLFSSDGQVRGDIRRMALESLEARAFQRLVLDGQDNGLVVPAPRGADVDKPPHPREDKSSYCNSGQGRVDDKAHFTDKSATYQKKGGYRVYLKAVAASPLKKGGVTEESETLWLRQVLELFGQFQLLAVVRKGPFGVEGLNRNVARILAGAGLISGIDGWYPGRPVMVTRNDYSLGLMNGDVGIYLPVWDFVQEKLIYRVVFPMVEGSLKKVLPSRLDTVETVYVMTVHKSQGSEFDHTVLVLPDTKSPVLTRELLYTGITRARTRFTLVEPVGSSFEWAVKRRTRRASGLGDLLVSNK